MVGAQDSNQDSDDMEPVIINSSASSMVGKCTAKFTMPS